MIYPNDTCIHITASKQSNMSEDQDLVFSNLYYVAAEPAPLVVSSLSDYSYNSSRQASKIDVREENRLVLGRLLVDRGGGLTKRLVNADRKVCLRDIQSDLTHPSCHRQRPWQQRHEFRARHRSPWRRLFAMSVRSYRMRLTWRGRTLVSLLGATRDGLVDLVSNVVG